MEIFYSSSTGHGRMSSELCCEVTCLLIADQLSCTLQIVEKLVDVVTYIHQAILEAFGNNGKNNIL